MTMNRILSILVAILVAATVTAQTTRRTTSKASGNPNAAAVVATVDGVGPLKLCLPMKKIPAKYAGLYDNFEKAPVGEGQGYINGHHKLTFYKDGKVVMTAIVAEWDDAPYGGVREINLPANSPIKFRIAPNKYILPNCPLSEVFSKATLTAGGLPESEAYMGGYTGKIGLDIANKPADYDWKTACVIVQNEYATIDDKFHSSQNKTPSMFKPNAKINGINIRFWVNEF